MGTLLRLDRKVFALHKWLGLVAGVLLLVIGVTGSLIVFRDEIDDLQFPSLPRASSEPGLASASVDRLFAAARAARPEVHVNGVGLLRREGRTAVLYWTRGKDYGVIAVDPGTARVLGSVDRFQSISDVLVNLHFTLLLSPWGDVVVAVAAF